MSTESTVVELKPVPVTAEGWCARLHADDASAADRETFDIWVQAAPENRAEYELSALTFAVANGLSQAPHLRRSPQAATAPRKARSMSGRRVTLAAVVALVVLAGGLLLRSALETSYATDVGERRLIALGEGSTVQLNTASTISVDLQPARRSVTLRRGEAFFNVAPDAGRPFVVRAGDSEIRVVGTKFNVRVDGDAAVVTVVDGKVNVVKTAKEKAVSTPVALAAGEGAVVAAAEPVAKLPEVNAARLTSWREGRIYFEQDPLSKVIEEVNRYSDIQFVIPDARTQALTLSGVFRTGDTDAVAFALRESYGVRTEREGRRIVVKPAS